MQADYSEEYIHLWRNHWWWQSRHEMVMRTIRKLRKKGDKDKNWRILDIGCGGGVAFDDLEKYGAVYGIEPNEHLAKAIPKWQDRIERRLFDATYQPDEKFDLVLMLDVLEHIELDEEALLALRKIVASSGRVIITVPALMSLWSAHDEVNQHFRRYTAANLETLLTSVGYKVHRLEYFFSWSLPLMYLRKALARKHENYAVTVPRWPLNSIFKSMTQFENLLRKFHIQFPLGSSLLAIVSVDDSMQVE